MLHIRIFLNKKNDYSECNVRIKTQEHNNRQNFNICIRNVNTNKETESK